jgi:HEAT repeat protein
LLWRPTEAAPGAAPADASLQAEVRRAVDALNTTYGQAGSLDWEQAKALIAQREKLTKELEDRLAQLGRGGAKAMAAGFAEAGSTRSKLLLVRALGKTTDTEATTELQGLLSRDNSFSLRKEMVVALGRRPEPAAAQALAGVLANSEDAQLRFASAQALSGRQNALPVLAERLQREAHPEVRKELVRSVALIGTPAAMALIEGIAQSPADSGMRQAAIQELGRSFGAKSLGVLDRLLNDPDEAVRTRAVKAVARVKTEAATALLRRAAASDASAAVRQAAAAALAASAR